MVSRELKQETIESVAVRRRVNTSGSEWSEFSRVGARHKDARPSSLCTVVVCTPEAAASFLAGTYGSLTKAT